MDNQVVLITGALTGIGRATAFEFARLHARVVVSGRRDKEGKALEAELRGLGAEAVFVRADVRHDEDVAALVETTVARFDSSTPRSTMPAPRGNPGRSCNKPPKATPPHSKRMCLVRCFA